MTNKADITIDIPKIISAHKAIVFVLIFINGINVENKTISMVSIKHHQALKFISCTLLTVTDIEGKIEINL